jgi:hypothetical protein
LLGAAASVHFLFPRRVLGEEENIVTFAELCMRFRVTTAILKGKNGGIGIGLVEIYNVH